MVIVALGRSFVSRIFSCLLIMVVHSPAYPASSWCRTATIGTMSSAGSQRYFAIYRTGRVRGLAPADPPQPAVRVKDDLARAQTPSVRSGFVHAPFGDSRWR